MKTKERLDSASFVGGIDFRAGSECRVCGIPTHRSDMCMGCGAVENWVESKGARELEWMKQKIESVLLHAH